MSGIAGVWNRDGKELDVAVLRRISASLGHRGRDGEGWHARESVGLACQHLWTTAEEVGERQPLTSASGVVLAIDGRLDNRDQLLRELDLPPTASDAACSLAAYERWGDRFAARLNGDFAIAVFDRASQQLVLARDAIGVRPLYYFLSDRLLVFGSEIKAVLAHPDVPTRPDDEGIADCLLSASRPVDRQHTTCFAGVAAVVPSHVVIVSAARVTIERHWDFDTGRAIRLGSLDEYVEAFRQHFAEAVRRRARTRGPAAVSVSGGLDSSSIFYEMLTARRAGRIACSEVVGISYIGAPGSDADEQRYVAEIERDAGVAIDQFSIEPLLGIIPGAGQQVEATEVPMLDYTWGITCELHRRATARGARVLLGGHWGDQVLFSTAYLVDLFRRLAWPEILRHRGQYVRWLGLPEARVLKRRFVLDVGRRHLPRLLIPPLKWIRRRALRVERPKPWLSPAFLRRGLSSANRLAAIGNGFHSEQARAIYFEARSKYHVHCMERNNKVCALHGLDVAYPFLDRDLLGFLMAIPGEIQNCGGVPRGLLREAMRGVLPERLRTRRGKGDFTSPINRSVAQGAHDIAAALSPDSLGVRFGYFAAPRLASEVALLSKHVLGPDCLHSWDLADVFGLEVWLRVFLGAEEGVA